jgi:GNAT superfamily N-acetyltransferase
MNDLPGALLRRLVASDIPNAVGLSEQAGWNQTDEDWQLLIDLAPEGCLAIDVNGVLAATTTILVYGRRLAWIGMVLTERAYRGRGFARRLLTAALTQADQMQIETVKLDATDQGRPLYETMGFRVEQAVERWSRAGSGDACVTVPRDAVPLSENMRADDQRAFGADRSELLRRLVKRGSALFNNNSYLLTRPGRQTDYLGPSVCDTSDSARVLVECALQKGTRRGWSWDLLPRNTGAVAVARDLAFTPTRSLHRMVRGKDLHAREESIYAIAGFELG